MDYSRELDFCIWVLEIDGLEVPPFQHHPDGDKSLRKRGLTVDSWRGWFNAVAAVVASQALYRSQLEAVADDVGRKYKPIYRDFEGHGPPGTRHVRLDRLRLITSHLSTLVREVRGLEFDSRSLPSVWAGDPSVMPRLEDLWKRFRGRIARQRRRDTLSALLVLSRDDYQALRSYLEEQYVQAWCVDYPGEIVLPMPPSSLILGVKEWNRSAENFNTIVRDSARKMVKR